MTQEESNNIINRYHKWINKDVVHIQPKQVLKLVAIKETPLENNSFDVKFILDSEFTATMEKNTSKEYEVKAKCVNFLYFKDNFILNQ